MAAESSRTFLLLAVLVLGIFADPCETQELRCQCIQTHSPFIPFKFISKVQLILEGAYCSRKEIIRWRDTRNVCTQRKGLMKTRLEDSQLQVKARGLRRNRICPHLDP
ncbi:C-X-C motif chemokine 15-like isoform X1 [Sturnira hondurensis]|uniref:C-X-C motif chemokine 15-like isoform X1 n=1 Tax=Sturnira hondurensis TaxID=192404 RepID=UPI00187AA5FD|nr:C-X-C motif chemokine 15-like isoform X1 [Sturnira hondurensis]